MPSKTRTEAAAFLTSIRGQYIMAQALTLAINHLSKVEIPYREVSNISDMQFLRDELFSFPAVVEYDFNPRKEE